MTTATAPVARCPNCRGWLTRRSLHSAEQPTIALVCMLCALDLELIGGHLVPVTRPPDAETTRDRARHNHAEALNATMRTRRAVRGEAGT